MTTKVYGASDDLIEFEGDVHGEVSAYGAGEDEDSGVLLAFDDGTLLNAKYGKEAGAIWALAIVRRGPKLVRVDVCLDEDAKPHSDVAHFKDGVRQVFAARKWERVK